MLKLRKANKALKRAKVVKEVNNTKDIENNDQERVPTPEETSKTGKKRPGNLNRQNGYIIRRKLV